MLASKKPNYERPATVISKETTVEMTKLTSKASVQINGTVIGDVLVEASLVVGQGGSVKGSVSSNFLLVAGTIEGNVTAKEQLHVTKSAIITGDIECGSIIIDEGAVLNGHFKTTSYSKPVPKKE